MVCYSFLDSKVVGKRYLKFPFYLGEFAYKLRIGKETYRQNSIYASLSGRLFFFFLNAIESIKKVAQLEIKLRLEKYFKL